MAEQQPVAPKQEVSKRKVKIEHVGPVGQRILIDVNGKQHLFGPGQKAEVELAEPEAKRIEETSKLGIGDLRIEGSKPEKKADAPEMPKEHANRAALAEKEAEVMEAGQEADKKRREEFEKKANEEKAAETGIHMYARGIEPEVVARPADALPKKK